MGYALGSTEHIMFSDFVYTRPLSLAFAVSKKRYQVCVPSLSSLASKLLRVTGGRQPHPTPNMCKWQNFSAMKS